MMESKGKRVGEIKMIPIEKINILNPRVRNRKVFLEIAENMIKVGMKRPITVTHSHSRIEGKEYDLICGQGRIEAFVMCGQTEIPAIVIDASEEQALIMSLVENLARRQHRASDLLQGIEILQEQGYDAQQIADKIGFTKHYVMDILNLMRRGEERLLSAVEARHMPISLAIRIAENSQDEQRVLHEAYETGQLRGNRLLLAKRLIDTRRRQGKTFADRSGRGGRNRESEKDSSVQSLLKAYQDEVDRKQLFLRKADAISNRLLFVTQALRQLFQEEYFCDLLRAQGLTTLPKPLSDLILGKGQHNHG